MEYFLFPNNNNDDAIMKCRVSIPILKRIEKGKENIYGKRERERERVDSDRCISSSTCVNVEYTLVV